MQIRYILNLTFLLKSDWNITRIYSKYHRAILDARRHNSCLIGFHLEPSALLSFLSHIGESQLGQFFVGPIIRDRIVDLIWILFSPGLWRTQAQFLFNWISPAPVRTPVVSYALLQAWASDSNIGESQLGTICCGAHYQRQDSIVDLIWILFSPGLWRTQAQFLFNWISPAPLRFKHWRNLKRMLSRPSLYAALHSFR